MYKRQLTQLSNKTTLRLIERCRTNRQFHSSSLLLHTAENSDQVHPPAQRSTRKKKFISLENLEASTTEAQASEQVEKPSATKIRESSSPSGETGTTDRYGVHRYPIAWKDADFYNEDKLENEMRRIFEVCHGCRRCFNLCESFPSLFDMIDKVEVLEKVPSSDFKKVVDKCTLCDLCYNNKCPYVPPHEFNIDFPHLMLRYRAVEQKKKNESNILEKPPTRIKETTGFLGAEHANKEYKAPVHDGVNRKLVLQKESELSQQLLTKMDRNGKILTKLPVFLTSFMMKNGLTRFILDSMNLVHKDAYLPPFTHGTLMDKQVEKQQLANASTEKVILYTTCLGNYNKPELVNYSKTILEKNGVQVVVDYKQCCGMPQFEQGDLDAVSKSAKATSTYLVDNYISKGYKVVTVVPSCSLMLKAEWANVLPDNENVLSVKKNTMDITEYIVYLAKKNGGKLPTQDELKEVPYSVSLHHACHSRAQNMGNKGLEMLKFIPNLKVTAIQRCSGHGGSFGVKKQHFDTAVKFGQPVAKKILQDAKKSTNHILSSECPLAAEHLSQVTSMSKEEKEGSVTTQIGEAIASKHPIEILYEAYRL